MKYKGHEFKGPPLFSQGLGPVRDPGLRVSRAYLNGLWAPIGKLPCSRARLYAFQGLRGSNIGIVWVSGLQAVKMMGSSASGTPFGASGVGTEGKLVG